MTDTVISHASGGETLVRLQRRVCPRHGGVFLPTQHIVRTGSSAWENTGLSSAAVIGRGAEGRKAEAVQPSNRTLEAPQYADEPGRRPAREGYAEGVDYPAVVGSNPAQSTPGAAKPSWCPEPRGDCYGGVCATKGTPPTALGHSQSGFDSPRGLRTIATAVPHVPYGAAGRRRRGGPSPDPCIAQQPSIASESLCPIRSIPCHRGSYRARSHRFQHPGAPVAMVRPGRVARNPALSSTASRVRGFDSLGRHLDVQPAN